MPSVTHHRAPVPNAFRAITIAMIALGLSKLPAPLSAQTTGSGERYYLSHLAGPKGGYGNADGTGQSARFWHPIGLAMDSAGTLYVADAWANAIRKVTPAGVVTTWLDEKIFEKFPESSGYYIDYRFRLVPWGVAVDSADNLYVAVPMDNLILKITPQGEASMYAGGRQQFQLYTNTDGPASQATFWNPAGIAMDQANNLYVADTFNHLIRKISPDGIVSTFAGKPPEYDHPQGAGVTRRKAFPGSADGLGLAAQFNQPAAVATDAVGNVYVADTQNHTIRKITPAGAVTTVAGLAGQAGSADGSGAAARFHYPQGLAVDAAGNILVADQGNGTVRRISADGNVTTLAGLAGDFRSEDGAGPAARFVGPAGLTRDRNGNILVGDGNAFHDTSLQSGTIRKIGPGNTVTTFVGHAGSRGFADGSGGDARFFKPQGLALDGSGNLFVADTFNHVIRRITAAGVVTTVAGQAGQAGAVDGPAPNARFNEPSGVAIDATGTLYIADHRNHLIRKITPDGIVSTLAGSAGTPGHEDGKGSSARFAYPARIAVDAQGTVYVTDRDFFPSSGDPAMQYGTIRKITADGTVVTLAGDPTFADYSQSYPGNSRDGTGSDALFSRPLGLTINSAGNLLIADARAGNIRIVTPDGVATTLTNLKDASGAPFAFHAPTDVVQDSAGRLLVSEARHNTIEQVKHLIYEVGTNGVVKVLAGQPGIIGSIDGAGSASHFNQPMDLALDVAGNLYVADSENHAIRKGSSGQAPTISTQPQSQTVASGSSVQFSVTADGTPAPRYQWHFNGTPINGATSQTLSLAGIRSADAGDYTVVVTNDLGSVTSNVAKLTVTSAPANPPPSNGSGSGGGGAPSWFFWRFSGWPRWCASCDRSGNEWKVIRDGGSGGPDCHLLIETIL